METLSRQESPLSKFLRTFEIFLGYWLRFTALRTLASRGCAFSCDEMLKTPSPTAAQAVAKWLKRRTGVEVRLRKEAKPYDWEQPTWGTFPKNTLSIHFQGLTTLIEWEQRHPKHEPLNRWNSEHLAYWFGSTQVISGHQNGCDIDLTTYTASPLWGLLGDHTYTD